MMCDAIVTTFLDEEIVEAKIVSPSASSTGLLKLEYKGRTFVRHRTRVTPANEAAKTLLQASAVINKS
jgi:hypothetical protein